MSTEKRTVSIGKIEGTGNVYKNAHLLGEVSCDLDVTREIMISRSQGGTEKHKGFKAVSGTLSFSNSVELLVGDSIVLETEDNPQITLVVTNAHPLSSVYGVEKW